jgi:hypothetical protein
MLSYYIGIGFIIFVLGGCFIAFLYIRNRYMKFDETETTKEEIVKIRAKIKESQEYFKNNYEVHVYRMIKLNIDLCMEMILNKKLEEQVDCLNGLYNNLYETGYRLKTNYDSPNYVIAPLKNFREKLAEELIDYLKDVERGL